MRAFFAFIITIVSIQVPAYGQHIFTAYVFDKATKGPLPGVVVHIEGTSIGNSAGDNGLVVLTGIPAGQQPVKFKMVGYAERTDTISFPIPQGDTIKVYLEPEEEEMEEAIVSSTRSSRTIQDIPTRVELIGGEEVDEKSNMKPGDIRMILAESTGIQTLQTSATSGNSNIRIEGMDGRYTQILKDGFPLYSGFSGGLGLLQTPPLDLKRVEIIKGSSSTLYGGGAIAGLVNLISKTPTKERELRFMLNGTSAKGVDVNSFYGQLFGKAGLTLYTAYNTSAAYAPSGTAFSAIPKFDRVTVNPRLFLYPGKNTDIIVGINTSFENRIGGDIKYLEGAADSIHSFYERNKSTRASTEFSVVHRLSDAAHISFKNSCSYFERTITAPGYTFDGRQNGTFSELLYAHNAEKFEWIIGGNFVTDQFREKQLTATPSRNYLLTTWGVFVQSTWNISKRFILEAGLRTDYVVDYDAVVLPRLSLLYKATDKLSSRLGGGLGYKTPTIFNEESERIIYRNVLPVYPKGSKLEKSYGASWDVNYKTTVADGKVRLSINQLFFYTLLNDPLILSYNSNGTYSLANQFEHIDAAGAETNVRIAYGPFKLFLGYTYTHAQIHKGSFHSASTLTPRHHTNSVLMYEVEKKWKAGIEGYYYSRQLLSDGTYGRDYWLCGIMAERLWKKFSVYVNFENILDSRQTRFDYIYTGSVSNPAFRDIYAPLDGFVFNGGVKISL